MLFGPLTSHWGSQERELFMGVAVPLIALIGLWPPLSAARIAYGLGLAFAFDLSLGFNGISYPLLHAVRSAVRGLRVPARMAIVVGMCLAILFGYGVARLCSRFRSRAGSSCGASDRGVVVPGRLPDCTEIGVAVDQTASG